MYIYIILYSFIWLGMDTAGIICGTACFSHESSNITPNRFQIISTTGEAFIDLTDFVL